MINELNHKSTYHSQIQLYITNYFQEKISVQSSYLDIISFIIRMLLGSSIQQETKKVSKQMVLITVQFTSFKKKKRMHFTFV